METIQIRVTKKQLHEVDKLFKKWSRQRRC